MTGEQVVKQLDDKKLIKGKIPRHLRMIATEYLLLTTDNSQTEIARRFGISLTQVNRDVREIQRNNLKAFGEVNKENAMGLLVHRQNILYQKAMLEKDYRLAWDITTGLIDKMGRMGFVPYTGDKHFNQTVIGNNTQSVMQITENYEIPNNAEELSDAIAKELTLIEEIKGQLAEVKQLREAKTDQG